MKKARYLILFAPFMLAACGEGWEMVRTDAFPYGNKRTAGTGVAYVLAKMMPKKELIVEQAVVTPAPVDHPKPADKIFEQKQKK